MVALKETIKNNRLVRHSYYFACGILKRNALSSQSSKILDEFGVKISDPAEKKALIKDMVRMYALHGFTAEEYLYFRFREKSMEERLSFVADWEHLGYTCAMNNPKNAELFDNKWKTYCTFKKYYGREILMCRNTADKDLFLEFISKHQKFIIKPLDSSAGRGIQIMDVKLVDGNPEKLFDDLMNQYHSVFVVEELIVPNEQLAKLHPQSVNTIRVPAVRTDKDVLLLHPFLRVGQHGNCVDNAGAGGIMCSIDIHSGEILAAADKQGHRFMTHPDTGENLVGFVVPRWEEAKALVKELANVVPDNRYAGWDITLTDKGWIMVEANRRGQFGGIQTPLQTGFRKELNSIMKEIGVKY